MADTHDTPRFNLEWGHKRGLRLTHASLTMLLEHDCYFCYKCSEVKPLSQFEKRYGRQEDQPRSECKSCLAERRAANGYNDRRNQRRKQYFQEWNKKRVERRRQMRNNTTPLQRKARRAQRIQSKQIARTRSCDAGGFIYVIHMSGVYKIGKTTNLKQRIQTIAGFMPLPTEHIHTIAVESGLSSAETWLHDRFAHCRLNGEWFRLSDKDLALLTAITSL